MPLFIVNRFHKKNNYCDILLKTLLMNISLKQKENNKKRQIEKFDKFEKTNDKK